MRIIYNKYKTSMGLERPFCIREMHVHIRTRTRIRFVVNNGLPFYPSAHFLKPEWLSWYPPPRRLSWYPRPPPTIIIIL